MKSSLLSTVLGIFQFRKGADFGSGPTVMVDDASRVKGHPVALQLLLSHICHSAHKVTSENFVNMGTQLWAKRGLQGLTQEM